MGGDFHSLVSRLNSIPPKNISLINPPAFFLTDDKVFFTLGLLSLAAVLENTHHKVRIYDLAGDPEYIARTEQIARENHSDIYGITSTSPQFSYALQIQRTLRNVNPKTTIAIGGPHASTFYHLRNKRIMALGEKEAYKQERNFGALEEFDKIIAGEEGGLVHLIEQSNEKWLDGGIFSDLDNIPFLPRHLIDMGSYLKNAEGKPKFEIDGSPATSLISQRGCPFSCNFCSGRNIPQYRQMKSEGVFRAQSPKRVVDEIKKINELHGVTRFMFYDDELNLQQDRTLRLLNGLCDLNESRKSNGLEPFSYRGFVKSELVVKHPEILDAMIESGFRELLSGYESGSNRILTDYVKKHTTREINLKCARMALDKGMRVKALTMVGHPTETFEDAEQTKSFLLEIGKMAQDRGVGWNFDVTVLCPYPGSPIYDSLVPNTGRFKEEFGKVLGRGELYVKPIDFGQDPAAYKTATGENPVYIRTEELSNFDLLRIRNEIDKEVRDKYKLKDFSRSEKDITHSMGQSSK